VESQLTPFLQTLAQASQAVLLLDYDGTLAPFHAERKANTLAEFLVALRASAASSG